MFEIGQLTRLPLGYVGEGNTRKIEIDMTAWIEKFPWATIVVEVMRPDRYKYLPAIEMQDGILSWVVNPGEVRKEGKGIAQIAAIDLDTGFEYRSRVVETWIAKSLEDFTDETLEDVDPANKWVNQVLQAAKDASDSADEAAAQADRAEQILRSIPNDYTELSESVDALEGENIAPYIATRDGGRKAAVVWEQGNLTNNGEASNSKVIRTVGMTPWGDAVVLRSYVADGYVLSYYQYTADGTLIIVSGVGRYNSPVKHADAMYYRLKLEKSPSAAIVPEEGHEAAQVFAIAPTKEAPITPITMGAVADGVADDTEAFQAAVNAGCDVFVPTSNGQLYKITDTIIIPNTCKRIYGEGVPRGTASMGAVIFDLTNHSAADKREVPLFKVSSDVEGEGVEAFSMSGFTVKCNDIGGSRVGLFMDASGRYRYDKDIGISNMCVTNFYRMFKHNGRGLTVSDCGLTSSNHIAHFEWNDAHDTNGNHPASMNHRGIIFKNNRLHSITSSFFTFASGHAYGFTLVNNTADVGRGTIIVCEHEAWNWLINGNIWQGMHCHTVGGNSNGAAIQLKGGARGCVISNNVFSAEPTFWSDGLIPDGYIDINGTATGCNIVGNNFRNCYKDCIDIQDANGVIINSNIFDGVGSTDGAAVTVVGGRLVSIMGNVSVTLPVGGFDNVSGVTGSSIDKNLYMS